MIRGAQKKMIVIRTHDSRVFEEAYFVMRRDGDLGTEESDMMDEADRIIRRSLAGHRESLSSGRQKRQRLGGWLSKAAWFGTGLFLGGGGASLFWLLSHSVL